DGPVDDVEQGRLAGPVPLGARQTPLIGPPTVSVHDDGDVPGHELRIDARRPCSAGVGRWGGVVHVLSRTLSDRILRSRCQETQSVTSFEASIWSCRSADSAVSQSPVSSAAMWSRSLV